MKNYIYILIGIIIFTTELFSQTVVVSEYNNVAGNADGEWTELLVVQDYVNLVGCIIRDNSDAASWSGGAKFKDVPLWQNLRIGTIIVISHRYSGMMEDKNPTDGYLEVSADDASLFDKITYNNPDWQASALSINQLNDMIQLLDASGNNLHTLGHSSSTSSGPYTEFMAITGPKLMRKGDIGNNNSLRVVPGGSVSDFDKGYDASNAFNYSGLGTSKGTPNQNLIDKTSNQQFWRDLRQPIWFNPNNGINLTNTGKTAKITWTPLESTNNPVDGYMIVRIQQSDLASAQHPIDGGRYVVGNFLGSAEVVGFTSGFSNSTYTDNNFGKLNCGIPYLYRIYAFRYDFDNQSKDGFPENGRGRSYNEDNYAETGTIERILPAKPEIVTNSGRTEFCNADNIIIQIKGSYTTDVSLQWFKDGNIIPGATSSSIKVNQGGQYYVKVKHLSSDCEQVSDQITISIFPAPEASLFIVINGNLVPITKDTAIYVCRDKDPNFDYPILNMQGSQNREWYFDDRLKTEELNKPEIIAAQKGTFYGVVRNGVCSDTTFKVFIDYYQFQVGFKPSPLFFDADDSPVQTLTIMNTSNVDLSLLENQFIVPPNFKFFNVTFPLKIKRNDSVKVDIQYTRTDPGNDRGKFRVILICSNTFSVELQGVKKLPGTAGLIVSPDTLDFGIRPICDIASVDSVIKIKSIGTISSKIFSPDFSNEVDIPISNFPYSLAPDSVLILNLKFIGTSAGKYNGIIKISSLSEEKNPKPDTSYIFWKIEIVDPILEFQKNNEVSIATCTDTAYQEIIVENKTALPITINKDFLNVSNCSIQNLPLLIEPNKTEKLTVRFISNIDMTINDNIEILPCNIKLPIVFNLKKSNISVATVKAKLDLGKVPACLASPSPEVEAELNITGGNVSIKSITAPNQLTTLLSVGEILSGNTKFRILYSGSQSGPISGKVKIVFDPCNYEVEYEITGEGITPKITSNPVTELNFGIVKANLTNNKQLDIKNDSPYPLELTLSFPNSNFSLNSNNPNPIKFNSLESKTILIDFFSNTEGKTDTGSVLITIKPCDVVYSLKLKAETESNKVNGTVQIDMPTKLSGKIGDIISLPISITPEGFTLKDTKIDKVKYSFKYNGLMLYPKNAKSLNPTGWINGSSVILTENSMNASTLSVNFNGIPNPDGNQWLNINLEVLLLQSAVRDSKIYLDSLIFESEGKIIAKLDSTEIEITDKCELQNRSITFDLTNQVPKINQKDGKLEIEFYTIADGDISIKLYTVNGETVHSKFYEDVKHGNYSTDLDLSNLQSGVYLLEIRTSTGTFTQKIIIIK